MPDKIVPVRFLKFTAIAVLGRVMWTGAYLGLGYTIGGDFEAATGFLGNLSGFLLCGTTLVVVAWIAMTSRPQPELHQHGGRTA